MLDILTNTTHSEMPLQNTMLKRMPIINAMIALRTILLPISPIPLSSRYAKVPAPLDLTAALNDKITSFLGVSILPSAEGSGLGLQTSLPTHSTFLVQSGTSMEFNRSMPHATAKLRLKVLSARPSTGRSANSTRVSNGVLRVLAPTSVAAFTASSGTRETL